MKLPSIVNKHYIDITRKLPGDGLPKFRKPKRFAELKVGDWLERKELVYISFGRSRAERSFYLVTDTWFDPVDGRENVHAGTYFAVARFHGIGRSTNEPVFQCRFKYTANGLASQRFQYSSVADPVERLRSLRDAVADGKVTFLKPRGRK